MTAPAAITVLTSFWRLDATKRIRQNRETGKLIVTGYGKEKHFRVQTVELRGFEHLCRCLDRLTACPFSFVIRGEPLPGIDREKARRLIYADPETGEPPTFTEAPRQWLAVDIDRVKKPVAIDPVGDPDDAIEHLIGRLPPELADASCWWQFTSSQNLPGHEDALSARLWFWLAEPLDDASLTSWAISANKAGKLIDPSLYRAVQPHYVAHPIFEDGMWDPLPRRHGARVGLDESVSLVIPQPSDEDPYVAREGYVGSGVAGHLAEIGGDRGFRAPMVSAIAAYYAANGADSDPEVIKQRVREAIDKAPAGGRSDAVLTRYKSDRHLNDIVGWFRARERNRPRPTPQPFFEMLDGLGNAVPVEAERQRAVRVLATHVLRRLDKCPHLAASLVKAWNAACCVPPLPPEQVNAIIAFVGAKRLREASHVV
jgi:hypothetical protein